jgi:hypothetical protein
MQILHPPGVQFLHAGSLDARISSRPECKIRILALRQKLQFGLSLNLARWPECNFCIQEHGKHYTKNLSLKSSIAVRNPISSCSYTGSGTTRWL